MDSLFGKEQVLTVPNGLSLVRLLMIPGIVACCRQEAYAAAAGLVVLSALTDVADGFVARRFGQVTDLGKILDPVADKLTLGMLLFCLIPRYRELILLLTLFLMREVVMAGLGLRILQKRDLVGSARWYGKIATAVLYASALYLLLFPDAPMGIARGLIILSGAAVTFGWLGYLKLYRRLLTES